MSHLGLDAVPDLYAVVFTTAPIILLTLNGSVVFGPVPSSGRHARPSHRFDAWSDVAGVALIFTGALISLLVLAGFIDDTPNQRMAAATSAGLALLLAASHVSLEVRLRYAPDPSTHRDAETDSTRRP